MSQPRLASLALAATALLALPAAAQSERPGTGAVPYPGGVTFRVWAPHAEAVSVVGDFNGWNPSADPLVAEAGGRWSADVDGAAVGDAYRYAIRHDGQLVTRRDPRARRVTDSDYETGLSVVYDPLAFDWGADAPVRPAATELVVYEMHVGTFAPASGAAPGTLDEAIGRLDDLVALGVNAVELLPVNEFPGVLSLGYDLADPFAVESLAYGGPDALKRFVKAAHQRGLAVIVDVVYNHWGPWDLHLHRFDGWFSDDYPGGVYFWDARRGQTPWGPRPNYAEPEVRRFILENLLMWVSEYRVDGFRWDSTSNIYDTHEASELFLPEGASLLRLSNRAIDARLPGFLSIAEDLKEQPRITDAVENGGGGFDSQWDDFAWVVRDQLVAAASGNPDLEALRGALTDSFNGDPYQRVLFLETHDIASAAGGGRLPTALDEEQPESWRARKLTGIGGALLMTAPGIPMLFQGQELLESRAFDPTTVMDWSRAASHADWLALWKDLIAARRDLDGTTSGLAAHGLQVHHLNTASRVLAYRRWDRGGPGDDVVVVVNVSDGAHEGYRIGLPRSGTWKVRVNTDDTRYGADFGGVGSDPVAADGPAWDGQPTSGRLDIAPYSVIVLSQDPQAPTERTR